MLVVECSRDPRAGIELLVCASATLHLSLLRFRSKTKEQLHEKQYVYFVDLSILEYAHIDQTFVINAYPHPFNGKLK